MWAEPLVRAALSAVDAERATTAGLERLQAAERLPPVSVFAFGKAAWPMARAACRSVDVKQGLVLAPAAEGVDADALAPLVVLAGHHPWPEPGDEAHGRAFLSLAQSLGASDVALCLVSGGGSAMLELPVVGLSLSELAADQRLLMRAGVDIELLNAFRSRLSQLKAGRLAAAMGEARVISLILSDVPGHPAATVASGPTVAEIEGIDVPAALEGRGLLERISPASRRALEREPTKLRLPRRIEQHVVADGRAAMRAMQGALEARGLRVEERHECIEGEARIVGEALYRECRERCRRESLDAIVFYGETTVTVRGSGRGGRNQELVLSALRQFDGARLLCFGTDGIDGDSAHAGAFLDESVVRRARALGLSADDALRDNDSARFFEAAGGALVTGSTGTNVADVGCYLRAPQERAVASSA